MCLAFVETSDTWMKTIIPLLIIFLFFLNLLNVLFGWMIHIGWFSLAHMIVCHRFVKVGVYDELEGIGFD